LSTPFRNFFEIFVAFKKHLCYPILIITVKTKAPPSAAVNYEVNTMSGEKIRALRKKAGMTQTELSEKLNSEFGLKTDRVMISKWETGFQTPVVSTLSCIAKVFGVTLDYLNGTENNDINNIEAAKVALFSGAGEVTDEMWQEVVNFAKYIEAREAAKNENN